jgi:hypothetical protein
MLYMEVFDRESFIRFVGLLREDFKLNSAAWENKTVDDFLEALGAYANDIQGYYDNTSQQINADIPSWKLFADILSGARIYE